jgi:hypothetical protein
MITPVGIRKMAELDQLMVKLQLLLDWFDAVPAADDDAAAAVD